MTRRFVLLADTGDNILTGLVAQANAAEVIGREVSVRSTVCRARQHRTNMVVP